MTGNPKPKRSSSDWPKTLAVMLLMGIVVVVLLAPAIDWPRGPASPCRKNLKQIGIALHNYHDDYGTFPPAYVVDETGKPLHSWRVLILPYVEDDGQGKKLYEQYDFSQPWYGPHNRRLWDQRPEVYSCPLSSDDETLTAYAAVVGKPCVFSGAEPMAIADITDGTSNTIIIGEATGAEIRWTEPRDVDFDTFARWGDPAGFSSQHTGGGFVSAGRRVGEVVERREAVGSDAGDVHPRGWRGAGTVTVTAIKK